VEKPDGTIKSVAEAKAEGAAEAQEAAAEGKTVDESGRELNFMEWESEQ